MRCALAVAYGRYFDPSSGSKAAFDMPNLTEIESKQLAEIAENAICIETAF